MGSIVVVLMSTYNGEKYLNEQLSSIFSQKDVVLKLIVRDDGSQDSTISILMEFRKQYPNMIEIIQGENIGWKKSFFALAEYAARKYSDYHYFAFADQDDIWLPEKLSKAVKRIESLPKGPRLYCSNLFFYKNGENLGKIRKYQPKFTYKKCLVRNYATGCTMVFNNELLKLVSRGLPTIQVAHDYWFFQIAVLCGSVYIDDESYILYRQHENNQIGCKSGWRDIWMRRLSNFKSNTSNRSRERQTKELHKLFSGDMHPEAKIAVIKMAFYRSNIVKQFALLCDNGYSLDKRSNNFWLKLRILLRQL